VPREKIAGFEWSAPLSRPFQLAISPAVENGE